MKSQMHTQLRTGLAPGKAIRGRKKRPLGHLVRHLATVLFLATGFSATGAVITDGLIGYWAADASATDSSSTGNNGVFGGSYVPGVSGQAFDLSTGTVRIPDSLAYSFQNYPGWTVAFWFNGSQGTFLGQDVGSGEQPKWFIDYGYASPGPSNTFIEHFNNFGSSPRVFLPSDPLVFPTGWNHLAVVNGGGAVSFYLNGNSIGTAAFGDAFPDPAADLVFGFAEPCCQYNGLLDEIVLLNRAITSEEARQLADGGPISNSPEPTSAILCLLGAAGAWLLSRVRRTRPGVRSLALLVVTVAFAATPRQAQAARLAYYDVAHSTRASLPIYPTYEGIGEAVSTFSPLTAYGLSPAWACCQNGAGQLSLSGWGRGVGNPGFNGARLEFSVTAKGGDLHLDGLEYSWFTTLNSDTFGGPDHVSVWASGDGFQTAVEIGSNGVPNTPPGAWRGPLSYFDDLSAFTISAGQTVGFRMVAWSTALNWDAGAGLWAAHPGNSNLGVYGTSSAPEPASWALALGCVVVMAFAKLRKRLHPGGAAALAFAGIGLATCIDMQAASIIDISIVPNSQANSRPAIDGIYHVTASGGVLPVDLGVGICVNPNWISANVQSDFCLHQHEALGVCRNEKGDMRFGNRVIRIGEAVAGHFSTTERGERRDRG